MAMKLKAYMVYPGNDPDDEGCILAYAETRNQARTVGYKDGPWIGTTYMEMTALRVAWFDVWAKGDKPYYHDSNDDLPKPFFVDVARMPKYEGVR